MSGPKLVITRNGKTVYATRDVYIGLDDSFKFASTARGYLNIMMVMTSDKQGNVTYRSVTVSPTGKVYKTGYKYFSGGINKVTFITTKKVKITPVVGSPKYVTFTKSK